MAMRFIAKCPVCGGTQYEDCCTIRSIMKEQKKATQTKGSENNAKNDE